MAWARPATTWRIPHVVCILLADAKLLLFYIRSQPGNEEAKPRRSKRTYLSSWTVIRLISARRYLRLWINVSNWYQTKSSPSKGRELKWYLINCNTRSGTINPTSDIQRYQFCISYLWHDYLTCTRYLPKLSFALPPCVPQPTYPAITKQIIVI